MHFNNTLTEDRIQHRGLLLESLNPKRIVVYDFNLARH